MFWDGTSGILIDLWCRLPSDLRNLLVENDDIYTLSFSYDGKYLASNSSYSEIYVIKSPLFSICRIVLSYPPDLGHKDKICTECL